MGVNTDGEEMGPGSTVIDRVKLTAQSCEVVQETGNEKSLHRDADGGVGFQDQKPAKGTGIPLIPFPKVPSQSSVLNTEHNEAHREHVDEGDMFLSNTTTTLQSDVDIEDRKTELSYCDPVFLDTDTFADDICIPLEECTSPLQLAEIRDIVEPDAYDASDAMYNIQLDETSPSDANAFKLELPFNPDIDHMDEEGYTPLYKAALEGHLEDVQDLISWGANPNKPSKGGRSPLHAAAQEGHTHIFDFLIMQGADVNVECERGTTPLHTAAANGYVDILERFISDGPDFEDNTGFTSLNAVIQYGHLEAVKYPVTGRAKQNGYDEINPLYTAARLGHSDIVKFFISNGADVNEEHDRKMIPLHGAAAGGHLEVMEYLIQQGSDLNKGEAKGWTPFNAAVQYGHLEAVKYLMTEGAKQTRYDGMTPLYAAAQCGHTDIVKFFRLNGADVNEELDEGMIPLHGAAARGHLEVLEYLIQQGSDVNKADAKGCTPFNAAVQEGNLEAVEYLMTQGAKQNRYDGMTPLYAAAQCGHTDIVKFFISNGADVNEEDDRRMIPLHGAAAKGNVEVMEYLIQQGSDLNKGEAKGWTPFNAAVQYGHLEAVKYLVTEGAKQNRYDGMTPLYAAAQSGRLDIVKFFISNGADVNEENDRRMIPLHGAAIDGNVEVIQYLIQHGSHLNKSDNTGRTTLHAAVSNGHLEVVKVLLAEGAKCTRMYGLTPLYIATQYDHIDVVNFLVSSGYDVNERNERGKSPLHAACYNGNIEIVKVLVHHNANINEQDDDGWTPLHAAAQEGHKDIVDYLTLNEADMHVRDIDGLTPLLAAVIAGHLNIIEEISSCRGDPDEEETGNPRAGDHQNLFTRGHVTVSMKDADTRSRTGQLASHLDNAEEGNDYTHADTAKRGADELSLKNLFTRTHGDGKAGNEEHNPFIRAKLKYPDKGEQDPMLDQMEAIKCTGTRKRDTITNGTDLSSPRGNQTWQYSGLDPPYLQTMETDGNLFEEPIFRCHSLIDENRQMRDSPSQMNAGNDLQISEPSEIESFPKHPPDVAQQKWYDEDPAPIQGTSSNPGWKIGTKRRTSVDRCPSILALVQTFLQMIIALAIILAGSPVLVAGSDITERVTLQAGKPGVVPFHLPWPPNSTSHGYFTLGFKYNPRPFCINGEDDVKGFKSPSQFLRFTTSVKDADTSPCVNLAIDNVDILDEGVYVLIAVWHSLANVSYETVKKEISVQVPPGPAKCFITLSENVDCPYEVHCRAITGSVTTSLSCYQNDQRIDIRGDIRDNGQVIRGIFWLSDNTYLSCCSHDVNLNVSQTMCNDFEWPSGKKTTSDSVNNVPTSVTTPTLQIESHTGSGACRQFMLPSMWHLTYLFVYFLTFATIY